MRRRLPLADLGDLLEQPLNAILATYLPHGETQLAPVWHEWRDGGFNVVILEGDSKDRNLQRDPRVSLLIAENGGLNRGLEVRGIARRSRDEEAVVTRRIAQRYLGPERTARFMGALQGVQLVHVRVEPGRIRAWDFADEDW